MARAEVTGKKLRVTDDRARRRKGPPRAEPNGPTSHAEPKSSAFTEAQPIRGPPVPPACFSIKTFCLAHHISESMFHKMRAAGLGPRVMLVGNRVLITFEAAATWRAECEAATAAAGEAAE